MDFQNKNTESWEKGFTCSDLATDNTDKIGFVDRWLKTRREVEKARWRNKLYIIKFHNERWATRSQSVWFSNERPQLMIRKFCSNLIKLNFIEAV